MPAVAVLDPAPHSRAHTRRLLAGLDLETAGFDLTGGLLAALASGREFSMLVMSFNGSTALAAGVLTQVQTRVGPTMPLMLLMVPHQVELAISVMDNPWADYLMAPYRSDELTDRLAMLYDRHVCPQAG